MTRVRGFTQDDAHIFCTEGQVADEFRGCIEMTQFVLRALVWTPTGCGWDCATPTATSTLVTKTAGTRPKQRCRRCAAIWGSRHFRAGGSRILRPKADFVVTDCIGREWQLGPCNWTNNLPSEDRFGLEYIGADNRPHRRDDPSGTARLIGTIRRRIDRAFCRGLSLVVARSRPGC